MSIQRARTRRARKKRTRDRKKAVYDAVYIDEPPIDWEAFHQSRKLAELMKERKPPRVGPPTGADGGT